VSLETLLAQFSSKRVTGSPITISPYTRIGMHWGVKINTSIYSIARWLVLALEKQCSNKAAFSSHANHPKATTSCSAVPGEARGAHGFPAPGSARTHKHSSRGSSDLECLDNAAEGHIKFFQVWGWVCQYLPTPVTFRAERHHLKRSLGEHQEHVQPGRIKMPTGTQRPKTIQRPDRLGRTAYTGRKYPATCLWTTKPL